MNVERQKRLSRAGWRVGTADEFLGLTAAESALVDLKLALAKEQAEGANCTFPKTP